MPTVIKKGEGSIYNSFYGEKDWILKFNYSAAQSAQKSRSIIVQEKYFWPIVVFPNVAEA